MNDIQEYINRANNSIEQKNYLEFLESIFSAKLVANEEVLLRVEILFAEGLFKFKEYKESFKLIDKLLQSGKVCGMDKIRLLQKKASIFCRYGLFEESINIYKILSNDDLPKVKMKGISNLGWVYLCMYLEEANDDYISKAIVYSEKALELVEYDNIKVKNEILINLGNAYLYKKDYNTALEYFREVEKNTEETSKILNLMALPFIYLSEFEEANSYLDKADLLATKQGDTYQVAWNHYNRAMYEKINFDYSKAKEHLIVAFDNLIRVYAYAEACKCLNEMFEIDHLVNKETISIVEKRLRYSFSNNFKNDLLALIKK